MPFLSGALHRIQVWERIYERYAERMQHPDFDPTTGSHFDRMELEAHFAEARAGSAEAPSASGERSGLVGPGPGGSHGVWICARMELGWSGAKILHGKENRRHWLVWFVTRVVFVGVFCDGG